jgi:hypothetical protein
MSFGHEEALGVSHEELLVAAVADEMGITDPNLAYAVVARVVGGEENILSGGYWAAWRAEVERVRVAILTEVIPSELVKLQGDDFNS